MEDLEILKRTAELAGLDLREAELKEIGADLEEIIAFISNVKDFDAGSCKLNNGTKYSALREDTPKETGNDTDGLTFISPAVM